MAYKGKPNRMDNVGVPPVYGNLHIVRWTGLDWDISDPQKNLWWLWCYAEYHRSAVRLGRCSPAFLWLLGPAHRARCLRSLTFKAIDSCRCVVIHVFPMIGVRVYTLAYQSHPVSPWHPALHTQNYCQKWGGLRCMFIQKDSMGIYGILDMSNLPICWCSANLTSGAA